jgi:hypothetical protein
MEPVITKPCPKCNSTMYSEGVNNGIGYYYPPFHCDCGYSDRCEYEGENCNRCDQYERCFTT